MKKVLSFLAAFVLLGAFAPSAWGQRTPVTLASGQKVYYLYNSTTQSIEIISEAGNCTNPWSNEVKPKGALVIPDSITRNGVKYPVTSIHSCTFLDCDSLTSVTIPNSVTSLGDNVFKGCTRLTSVTIGNSVTLIGSSAFYNCNHLTTVTIPNSVTSIGNYAFQGCSSLTSVSIGNSVTSIGSYAFYNCNHLNSVTIPNSVTFLGSYAFSGCSSLDSVTIGNSVTTIGGSAFLGCSSLDSVTIGNSVTTIGFRAFQNCSNLYYVTIPESVTSIGDEAFRGCAHMTTAYMMSETPPTVSSSSFTDHNHCSFLLKGCSYSNYAADPNWSYYTSRIYPPLYDIDFSVSTSDSTRGTAAVILGIRDRVVRCDSTVVVQATANHGYHFDHWSNGSTSNPDTLALVGDSTVTAYFEKNDYAVVGVTSAYCPNLIDFEDTTVNGGFTFYNPNNNKWYSGAIDSNNHALFISNDNGNSNNYDRSSYYAAYAYRTINLAAGPTSFFYDWRCLGASNTDFLRVALLPSSVSVTASGWGVETLPAGAIALDGGSQLYGWSSWQTKNVTVQIPTDGAYKLVFYWHNHSYGSAYPPAAAVDNIFWENTEYGDPTSSHGYVTGSDTVPYLDTVTLVAHPNYGYHFNFWNYDRADGNGTSIQQGNDTLTLAATRNRDVVAYFAPNQYNLTVDASDSILGGVTGSGSFNYFSKNVITAMPNQGYHFDHWSNGSTANPDTITLVGDSIITAYFIGLTVLSNDNTRGSVSHSKIGDHLEKITATANYGYHFDHWSNGSTSNPDTVTLTGDSTVTAYFAINQYAIIGSAESLSYSFDFDDWHDDNLFDYENIQGYSWWTIGEIDSATRALFVTNGESDDNGYSMNEYFNTSSAEVYEYTTVYLLKGDLSYSYDWRGYGEGGYDYLRVALLPQNMDVTASGWGLTTVPTGAIALDGGHKLNLQSNWTTQQGTISIPNSGYYKLVFRWRNDNSAGTNPPAAVDNIVMVSTLDSVRGIVVGSDTVDYLDTVTLTAIPNEHYHFTQWNDGDTTNPRQVVATDNTTLIASFAIDQYQLTVNVDDSTHGSVSGGGSYGYNTSHTITATANYGYHFDHWSNGSTTNPDTITLVSDSTVTAYFAINQYAVVGNTSDSVRGLVEGSDTVDYQDTVTLTAVANYGYHFDHWNDGDTTNPRQVAATSNINITAYFEPNQYALVTATNDTLRGSSSMGVSESYYAHLSLSDFTQMTSSTSRPAGYGYFRYVLTTSITNGSDQNCYYKFKSADGSMYWNFTPRCTGGNAMGYGYQSLSSGYNLFTDTTIGNTITYSGLQGVKITYTNLGWLIEFPVDVCCTQRESYAAYSSVYWAVCLLTGDTTWFDYLSDVPISATANYGYHFDHWSNGSTANPDTITLISDSTVTAYFAINQYTITGTSANTARGTVTGSATVDYLDTVTLIAHPNYGYHLDHWTYTNENNNNTSTQTGGDTLTLVAKKDRSATAYFNPNQYQLTVNVDNSAHGSVSGGGTYNYNTSHTITATASDGYHFDHWSNGSTANPANITLTSDSTVTAYFERNSYNLTVNVNDATLGTVTTPDGTNALYGDTLTVVATHIEHYHVASWQGQGIVATSADKDSVSVRMLGNRTITCNFAIDTHTVAVTSNDIARGSVSATGTEFAYGSPCTVSATAYTGYTFQSWSNGVTANPYTFAVMEDVELTAIFVVPGEETYTVTVSVNDPTMGSATVNGNTTATVTGGSEVTLTATPNAGYRFVRWNDDNTEETRTVTVTADMSFTAYFESTQGIGDIDAAEIKIYIIGGRIVVTGAEGMETRVYDLTGREVVCPHQNGETPVLPSGVYLVKVGTLPARKVVVMR